MVQQADVNTLLEYQDDVGTPKEEIAHVVTTLQLLTDVQAGQPVDTTYL